MNTLKDLEAKVQEVIGARDAVYAFMNGIEDAVEEGKEAVKQLESVIESKKEALSLVTDMGEARLAKQEIDKLVSEIELQKMVNVSKETAMKAEAEAVFDAFYAVHKVAKTIYTEVDRQLVINTPLVELYATKKIMVGLANDINNSFSGVTEVLKATGILENGSKHYKGIHLNQRGIETEFYNMELKFRPYIRQLDYAGYDIKVL